MKARHAARELAILALFQIEKQGGGDVSRKTLEALILDAVRALSDQAEEQIRTAAQDLAAVSQTIIDFELEHPTNLESPLEALPEPVPIPTTREMVQKIETVLQAAEYLMESLRVPELAAHTHAAKIRAYAIRLVELVLAHRNEIDQLLNECSEEWKVGRMVRMDREILRVAVAEMAYVSAVDHSVSIDEAVELAKRFSTSESSAFINGILGKVAGILPSKPVPAVAISDEEVPLDVPLEASIEAPHV